MLYWDLLIETLSVVVISILITLVIYIFMCWILSRFNKYNVKNFAFIFCSFLFIPFMFYELSLFFACNKVESSLVEPARKYAQSIAYNVDTYTSGISKAVNKTVDNFVSKKAEEVKDEIGDEIVDCTVGLIKESTTGVVSETMNLMPTNLVSELKEKFPALSIFLTDQDINGDTCEEIINSIFNKVTNAIDSFKITRILTLLKYTIFFVLLSLFCGWRKTKRKQKKMDRDISEGTEKIPLN